MSVFLLMVVMGTVLSIILYTEVLPSEKTLNGLMAADDALLQRKCFLFSSLHKSCF